MSFPQTSSSFSRATLSSTASNTEKAFLQNEGGIHNNPLTIEEFLEELSNERSQPEYTTGNSSYTSHLKDYNLEMNEDFEADTNEWALSASAWPQITAADMPAETEKDKRHHYNVPPISLVRLDDLREYICQFTSKLRIGDCAENIKLVAEEDTQLAAAMMNSSQDEETNNKNNNDTNNNNIDDFGNGGNYQDEENGKMGDFGEDGLLEHTKPIFMTEVANIKEPEEKNVDPAQLAALLSFPLMVESVVFPVLNDTKGVTTTGISSAELALSNNISPAAVLTDTLQSRNLPPGVYRRWKGMLTNKSSIGVFTHSFWIHLRKSWVKLTEFSPQLGMRETPEVSTPDEIEEYISKLRTSLSRFYVKLLTETDGADKDDYFLFFPDFIGQAVFNAFCECFPKSIYLFDEDFKAALSESVYTFISGIKPYKLSRDWPIPKKQSQLADEAKNLNEGMEMGGMNNEKATEDGANYTTTNNSSGNASGGGGGAGGANGTLSNNANSNNTSGVAGNSTNNASGTNSKGGSKKIPSMVVGPNYLTQRIWFDMYGNSPIVSHYLNVFGGKNERKNLKIHRSQIVKDNAEDESLTTYRQIVAESLKKSKARDKLYSQRNAELQKDTMLLIRKKKGV